MAFITACYKKFHPDLPSTRSYGGGRLCVWLSRMPRRYRRYLLLSGLFCLISNPGWAAEFSITSIETTQRDKVYFVSAKIKYDLSNEAKEALENGIPLLILLDIEVAKPRWWWWDKSIANLEQGYLLIYHALSENYIIHNLNSGTQENFVSLTRALTTLGELKSLPILDANLLQPNTTYYLRMRTYLDIESLPAPMQPIAYVSSNWQLESDWYQWPLQK